MSDRDTNDTDPEEAPLAPHGPEAEALAENHADHPEPPTLALAAKCPLCYEGVSGPTLDDALSGLITAADYADDIGNHTLAKRIADCYQDLGDAAPHDDWVPIGDAGRGGE